MSAVTLFSSSSPFQRKKNQLTDNYMFLKNKVFVLYFTEGKRAQIPCHTAINVIKPH